MATVTAFQIRQAAQGETARLPFSDSRGIIGAVLFLLVAFFLLAAGAAAGAFILDPSIGPAPSQA
jgi:hypothetical protein